MKINNTNSGFPIYKPEEVYTSVHYNANTSRA